MITQAMEQVGQALVVHGTVQAESVNGVSTVLQPNSPIFMHDAIDTGSDGALSIVFSDNAAPQLELDRMTSMTIDDDVLGNVLPDLGDVSVESGIVQDLLQNWEAIEPVAALETLVPDLGDAAGDDGADTDMTEAIPGLEAAGAEIASSDIGGDGDDAVDGVDYDFDLTSLIPPPDDGGA
jgi:hypothetical protein